METFTRFPEIKTTWTIHENVKRHRRVACFVEGFDFVCEKDKNESHDIFQGDRSSDSRKGEFFVDLSMAIYKRLDISSKAKRNE